MNQRSVLCSWWDCYVLALFLLQEHVWGMDSIMDGYLFGEMEDYEAVRKSYNWVWWAAMCSVHQQIRLV